MEDDHNVGRLAIGAACAIFDDRGRVLLVRHSYGRRNWELPGGGAQVGEPPNATARRELFEETGLELTIGRLTGVYFEHGHADGPFLHFVFGARWEATLLPDVSSPEIAEIGWWSIDELPTPISDFTERRVRDAATGGAAFTTIEPRKWRS